MHNLNGSKRQKRETKNRNAREPFSRQHLGLFSEDGYDNVTMRKIADEIEYSVGTIYLYFKDRDEIFFELHKMGFEEIYKRQMLVQAVKDPLQRLTEHGLAYIQFAIDKPQYYDLMFISRIPTKTIKIQQHWKSGDRTYDVLKLNISQAKEAGILRTLTWKLQHFHFGHLFTEYHHCL